MSKTRQKKTLQKQGNKKYPYLIHYVLIAVITFILYSNSLSNAFVFDDESVVLGDPTITNLNNIPKYFTGEEGFHRVIGRYYRPVISTSYAIDYAVWNLNPTGFHITNIIIHIINSLLLFKLLLIIFRQQLNKNISSLYILLLAVLVFAVHAIHTEAVTWISGRTDSFSYTFFILSFIYYLKYKEEPSNKNLIIVIISYILSLLAKEMAITLPVVIILYDQVTNYDKKIINIIRTNYRVYLILIVTSLLYMIWRWYILKDVPERLNYNYFYGESVVTTIATMLTTLPLYFRLTFIPVDLLYHYSGYLPYQYSFAASAVLLSVLFIVIVLVVAIYLLKKLPLTSFSLFIFFVTLIPVMNIVPTMNFMAERFLYIPSMIVSLILAELSFKFQKEKYIIYIYGLFVIIILFNSVLTFTRNKDWKDNDTLFLSAENKPGTVTYVNIGNIYANKGQIDIAEGYYRKAIDLRDKTILANNNLGKVFLMKNNFDSSYYYMHKAFMLDSLSPEPMFSLAQLFAKSENLDSAIFYLEKINKVIPNGYMNSGQLLENLKIQKKMNGEKQPLMNNNDMLKVSQLQTESYQAYSAKDYPKAISILNQLIRLDPLNSADYYNNIGMCYFDQKDFVNAEKSFKESIKQKPDYSIAYNNLGKVYEMSGKKVLAKENYLKALQLDSANTDAKNNLNRLK